VKLMSANYKAELVVLFGQPVAENPTVVMQEAAFAACGLNWRYLNIEVSPEKLADAMIGARAFGVRGMNLTIPHKIAVMQYLDEITPSAQIIGAVNTVKREGDRLIGENTDGKGFLRGIRTDAGVDPAGKRVVMLGAGGAARAIGAELLLAGASELIVVNRSAERGEAMVAHLRQHAGGAVNFVPWDGVYTVSRDVEVIVNATSIGLYPDVDAMPAVDLSAARADLLVCDVIPNPPHTPLLRAAESHGLPTLDGLSMLVYQGMIGFEFWTGYTAPQDVMTDALRAALGV
jgi:shikimate dehydrogenase